MIEVYQGELTVSVMIPNAYTVTAVTITQKMYDDVTGDRVDEDTTPAYTEEPIGATPTHKYVHVDVSNVSGWPSPFTIRIDVLVDGDSKFIKSSYDIVVPYATVDEIVAAGNIDLEDINSSNYKTYQQVRDAEAIARHTIESYTGRFFGRSYSKWDVQGTDKTVLFSDEHILWLGAVFHDDEAIYDSDTGSYEVSESGHTFEVKDDDGERYGFPEGYKYSVIGIFGNDDVPYDVTLAAKQLAVHFLCSDSATQNNYIDQVKFGESANRYNRLAFYGTGLHNVDLLLNKYRFHNYKVL
jgi:hypothetical protein